MVWMDTGEHQDLTTGLQSIVPPVYRFCIVTRQVAPVGDVVAILERHARGRGRSICSG
jgi:hypothetical protein